MRVEPTVFKRELMCLIRPPKKSLSGTHDMEGVRLLTRLRVEFSDLREHTFRQNTDNSKHFLLHCPRHSSHRRDLLDRISIVVDVHPENLSSTDLCDLLLDGNSRFSVDINHHIIESTIFFVK